MKKIIVLLYPHLSNRLKILAEKFLKKFDGGEYWSDSLRKIYKKNYDISIGTGTYGVFKQGKYKYINFGNYCSIANGLEYFPRNHPKNFATTHPVFYNDNLGLVKNSPIEFSKLIIENDVWIGKNVMITSKCDYIGNGAIIGAGSVVTKNVEPYTIVAGNPAKVIGMRFDEKIIDLLEKSKWYELSINELKKYIRYVDNPEKFANKIIESRILH